MTHPGAPSRSPTRAVTVALAVTFSLLCSAGIGVAQQNPPDEHAAHHPEKQDPGKKPGEGMGGMMGDMEGMMRKMGVPPPKELYPSLMELPDLPLEKRGEVQAKAHERMKAGAARLAAGLDELGRAAPGDDFAAMQAAVEAMREGLAEFQSGLATHRALAEGKSPRSVAMQWFKSQMNLLPPLPAQRDSGPFGLGWFHFWLMAALVTFTAAMLWMYFHKMRRATELLATLATAEGVPVAVDVAAPTGRADAAPGAAVTAPRPGKWSGSLRVCQIFSETPNIKTFRMVAEDGGAPPFLFLPGQFLTLSVSSGGKTVKRSYTIASSPTVRGYVEITVKREEHGVVSSFLHDNVTAGDTLAISAPAGRFTFTGAEASSIVLIGAGVGITPLMSVIRYLTDIGWPGEIVLVFACRTPKDYVFRDELERLQQRHDNLSVVTTMTRAKGKSWSGPKGRVTPELITQAIPDIGTRRIHICGPNAMMDATKEMLAGLGVPAENIKIEAFGPAKKKAPSVEAPGDSPAGDASTAVSVTFAQSQKTAPLPADQTVLDVADAAGVDIDNSCRSGTCGSCKVKLLEGQVEMEVEDGLEPEEKAEGWILACQATSKNNVAVDA